MKTYTARRSDIKREWYLIDAKDKVLGRVATEIARRLRGKHKPEYTPHMGNGDYIVVINAERIRVTGRKASQKVYYRHSGYPGGLKSIPFEKLTQHAPHRVIELAVRGMLPRGPLGRAMFRRLRVYAGCAHKHAAQQPKVLEV